MTDGQIQEGKNLVMEEKNGVTGTGNMGFLPPPPPPSRPVNLGQGILTLNFPATKCYNMCQTSLLFHIQKNMHISSENTAQILKGLITFRIIKKFSSFNCD
jgi:hypothetical protein